MKYTKQNPPYQCYMTQSDWYRKAGTTPIRGVLWHSTGANNPRLSRYVQPDDNAKDRAAALNFIGENTTRTDWNHCSLQCGVHAFIGKRPNGEVATVNVGPWNKKAWGCGSGAKGSCNNGWIQFEICEDNLDNKEYFDAVYQEACELTAYLCELYKLDPLGITTFNGVKVPVILCHADSHALKLGSNHGDVLHWFKKYNKTMDDVRRDVAKLMNSTATVENTSINSLAKKGFINSPAYWQSNYKKVSCLDILLKKCDNVLTEPGTKAASVEEAISNLVSMGIINSPDYWMLHNKDINYLPDLLMILGGSKNSTPALNSSEYAVIVNTALLNVRTEPSMTASIIAQVRRGETYTILEERAGWGKLKERPGWVSLNYTRKK